jgi:hypothetical protein
MGGWVDPRAGLDAVVKRKIPSLCRELNPRSSPISKNHLGYDIVFSQVVKILYTSRYPTFIVSDENRCFQHGMVVGKFNE